MTVANYLTCACLWLTAGLVAAQPLIPPTTIDWLLDCPLSASERLDPEVIERTQCGFVTVPRNHAMPEQGSLRLTVTRVGARQPLSREGVVFTQPGGAKHTQDGTFAIRLAGRWESYATQAYRTLVNRYDVIELSARDLNHENSIEQAARDMEFVRTQLGDAQLSFVGNADATRLGSRYGALFPQHVARMVLVNAGQGEPVAAGVEQLLLKEPPLPKTLAMGCVKAWLGEFLAFGKHPPPTARCLDAGYWE
ncbi:alpha/beta hydrolase [Pseudomonas tritici]|uniref:alpha/beta hydrolase n=1 Tax=Pseudomonas tritici TaxID=2745518 RepID=UPI00387AF3A2